MFLLKVPTMEKSSKTASKDTAAPEGFKVLKEGQANILYIEQKLEKDA